MTKRETRQYEMFVRVRDFGVMYRDRFPAGSTGGQAFAAVEAAVAQLEASGTSKLTAKGEGQRAKVKARRALTERVRAIARTARVVADTVPGAETFRLPEQETDVALLTAARAFLQAGEAVKAEFVAHGLPDSFIGDLQQVITTFEQAIGVRQAGQTGATLAQIRTKAALAQGLKAIRTLDVIVLNLMGENEEVLGVWKLKRHVVATGKSTSPDTASLTGETTVSPVPSGEAVSTPPDEALRKAS